LVLCFFVSCFLVINAWFCCFFDSLFLCFVFPGYQCLVLLFLCFACFFVSCVPLCLCFFVSLCLCFLLLGYQCLVVLLLFVSIFPRTCFWVCLCASLGACVRECVYVCESRACVGGLRVVVYGAVLFCKFWSWVCSMCWTCNAHAGSRTRVTSMGGLYDAATLRAPAASISKGSIYNALILLMVASLWEAQTCKHRDAGPGGGRFGVRASRSHAPGRCWAHGQLARSPAVAFCGCPFRGKAN
jgi:hypothetical protein